MKGRKLLALALALALALGLSVPALAAESTHEDFRDLMLINPLTNDYQWKWAWPTVDDTLRRGLFIGYTPYQDAQGNTVTDFGPGDMVTESVGLTLCARMIVDTAQRETILKDRLEQMREIIPGTADDPDDPNAPNMWFRREAATCLELGVISEEDLLTLRDANRLGSPMSKADFAVYLVRAMGLEDFAKGLNAQDLSVFKDEASIGREYRPYVKLLHTYGVLTGDENQNFNPTQGMNRAVCATMLSRAIENILEERGVAVELPRYTTYPFAAGTIREVSVNADGDRVMTLDGLDGERTFPLPAAAQIYQNNMPAKTTDLKNGSYAKLRLNEAGEVVLVQLTPAGTLSQVKGKCDSVDSEGVVVDGVRYAVDRFTRVSAGGQVGDVSVLDPSAGYTQAEMTVNSRKVVLAMTLSGGTRRVDGILTDVNAVTQGTVSRVTATVNAFNGLPTTYDVTSAVTVTAKGQTLDGLKESFEGKHVVLRVSDGDFSQLKSVDVDLDGQYIQGVLQSVNNKQSPVKVEITRAGDSRRTSYEVDEECQITYEGKSALLKDLTSGSYVTAKLEGATVTVLDAWTGLESVSGTLSAVTYADPTVLVVTDKDGARSEFSIPLDQLKNVTILVDGEDGDITNLAKGDSVVVTLRYHTITQIDVTPREADVTGTLNAITINADGSVVLDVRLPEGTTHAYTATSTTTVTRDGKPVDLLELAKARGLTVSLVTNGDQAVSVQYSGTATPQDTVEGTILNKDDQSRIATVLVYDAAGAARPVNVHIASGTTISTAEGTILSNITRLNPGDSIQVYGSYNADGTFEAKLVIRR